MKKRILFYRSGAIGDIIHCLPTLRLAKQENPEASIEFVVAIKPVKELLEATCSYIDKVHYVKRNIDDSQELLDYLQANDVDEFVYLHSTWFKALWWNLIYVQAKKLTIYKKDTSYSAIENFLVSYEPKTLLGSAIDHKFFDKLEAHKASKKFVGITVGVGNLRPHRAYPPQLWIETIKKILAETDHDIKLLGGPDEAELASEIYRDFASEARVENLIAKTSLLDLAQMLAGAEHLFSADTGILHIASAANCPSTSVFSITSENRTGAFHPEARALRSNDCACAPDNSNSQKHCKNLKDNYPSCVWEISPEELIKPLQQSVVIANRRSRCGNRNDTFTGS